MPRGRGRVQQRRPQVEIADREGSPNSSSSDLIPETPDLQDTQAHPSSEEEGVKKKKRIRASKKDIPDYRWKEDNELVLVDLVKDHPQLYDKKHRDHLNTGAKNTIWERVGEQLNPPAIGAQCKKHYDNMRTRVGKILRKEKKSGAGRPERSDHDGDIMTTWSFLIQHIVRGKTIPCEKFAAAGSAMSTDDEEEEVEAHSTGSQSQSQASASKGKGRRSRPSSAEATSTSAVTVTTSGVTHTDLSEAMKQILSRADALGTSQYTGQQKIVHDFACLLEGHMQGIPEECWHDFQMECLNLVHQCRQPRPLFQQPQRSTSSM